MPPHTPILYQNASKAITLIDIPTSITAAQDTSRTLFSSPPLQEPFVITNEPKSQTAREKVLGNTIDQEVHVDICQTIETALAEAGSKRKRKADEESDHKDIQAAEPSLTLATDITPCTPPITLPIDAPLPSISSVQNRLLANPTSRPQTIAISNSTYHIPPHSTLLLGNVQTTSPTLHASRPSPNSFDLIVLDPPYPNRSAKRAATYARPPDTRSLLSSLGLPALLSPTGLLAVWITNKPSLRALFLARSTGLFAEWDVGLLEEWIWLKTTTSGAPASALSSAWRKPYEVLLVARRNPTPSSPTGRETEAGGKVRRRVVLAVPDVHSRKPHLGELFLGSSLLPSSTLQPATAPVEGKGEREVERGYGPGGYAALEIFARIPAAGWWSWGDEVLRFAWEGWWDGQSDAKADDDDDDDTERADG
ncbi:MAG: Methyltransferase-like protein 4 [Thelocarpon impressellum]|nr:MAG: Methyltransferase-like protein 4 [Thelocarpon impressellum]